VSSVIPVYQGTVRAARGEAPQILVNPRATIPFGSDTLHLYLEAYGFDSAADSVAFRALDEEGNEVWRHGTALAGGPTISTAMAVVDPGALPIGELRVEAVVRGGEDTVRAPVLVSFSEHWVVANFEEVLNLLRFFGYDERIRAMRDAPAAERPDLWREFWAETDPNPATPEHEALNEYFGRVQRANVQFREGNQAGWLTDRGEVFINLGEPDEVFDQSSDLQGQRRAIRWTYTAERLTLEFVDDSGFGRFRLTPSSRAEYQRVLNRVRRA
jgi:GWxTD domain-containing protein